MRSLIALLLLAPAPALATVPVEKYQEACWVNERPSVCTVVDTRTPDGFINTRNIYNNEYSYTFKQRWVEGQGFVTWDSVTKREYKYQYQPVRDYTSRVSPHLVIMNVSWD